MSTQFRLAEWLWLGCNVQFRDRYILVLPPPTRQVTLTATSHGWAVSRVIYYDVVEVTFKYYLSKPTRLILLVHAKEAP